MAFEKALKDKLVIPAVCAPMFLVSNPCLVREACKVPDYAEVARLVGQALDAKVI